MVKTAVSGGQIRGVPLCMQTCMSIPVGLESMCIRVDHLVNPDNIKVTLNKKESLSMQ